MELPVSAEQKHFAVGPLQRLAFERASVDSREHHEIGGTSGWQARGRQGHPAADR